MNTPSSLPLLLTLSFLSASSAAPSELLKPFEATPNNPTTTTPFQPILTTPNFSLCFLPSPDRLSLTLSVIHLPSLQPLWSAPALFHPHNTLLTFNGSLVVSSPHTGAFWSTHSNSGSRLSLSPNSNLQIFGPDPNPNPLWQSFDSPSDTLVQGQNLSSKMSLVSSNNLYTLRLGPDYIGLYAEFNPGKTEVMYYKHSAMQAKANIVTGQGPVTIRVSPDGYLGMYQQGSKPADVVPFSSYERPVPGIRIIRVEQDGNLKAYYWSGSDFVLDYQAISATCELPSPCGAYGLCRAGAGSGCSCLNNETDARPGECYSGRVAGDFCGANHPFTVFRRVGVEVPYKELMGFIETASFERCVGACESNCTCWGAVYSNSSGRCYTLDYPIQTLVSVGDVSKVGYLKVREGVGSGKVSPRLGVGIALLCVGFVLLFGAVGFGGYRVWKRRRGVGKYLQEEDIVAPGPYKDLGSESFGSVELSNR